MTTDEVPNALRDLARAADSAASSGRPWQVGHRLAKDLTADERSMTDEEMAVVQALEWSLDLDPDDGGEGFHAWWLDEDTSLAEFREAGLAACEAVAAAAAHPTVVAHLSDLLWSVRHGQAHLHARRAVDAYLAAAASLEPHDRCRALIRAHQLTRQIGDRERQVLVEAGACDAISADLAEGNLSIAISLLEHLTGGRLEADSESNVANLIERAWRSAHRPNHVERLAKLQLRRHRDDESRLEISGRAVAAFRTQAAREEGFRRLLVLRDALRVAEELGHPSHQEIVHEIETLDLEGSFSAVRSEHVLSRSDVAEFCADVVGADSLERALCRFAQQLPVTPESVQQTWDSTSVGIRHLVTNYRFGEANSVVTSSETTAPEEDAIAAAVERDVLQQVGWGAQMGATVFLVPALHQVLESYEPWDPHDLIEVLEQGAADPVVAEAMSRAVRHFHRRRYDEAIHVALPRIERLIRHVARSCGVATTRRPTARVGGIRGLGEILYELRGDDAPLLPEPFLTSAELLLVHPDSLNLRNEYLHGIQNEARAADAALILQLGLALCLLIRLERRNLESESTASERPTTPKTER